MLGFLRVQRSNVTAIGLLDANGNLAAKFLVAQPLHGFGFAKPAIQFPTILRGEPLCGRFDFCDYAHGKRIMPEPGIANGVFPTMLIHA